jgi:type IV pilus assembly protein PilV
MKSKSKIYRLPRNDKGFTLLEVLVTLVITAIALLGIAGLQAQAFRMNKGGEARAQALIAANEIIERIEANIPASFPPGGAQPRYVARINDVFPTQAELDLSGCANANADILLTNCPPATLATYDLGTWRNQIESSSAMSGAQGIISARDVLPGPPRQVTYDVTICWRERVEKYDQSSATRAEECGADTDKQLPGLMSVRLTRVVYDRSAAY